MTNPRPTAPSDRRVHARHGDGTEVVRYDRSGKWYVERGGRRRPVSLDGAVTEARRAGTECFFGVLGGNAFDRSMQAAGAR